MRETSRASKKVTVSGVASPGIVLRRTSRSKEVSPSSFSRRAVVSLFKGTKTRVLVVSTVVKGKSQRTNSFN